MRRPALALARPRGLALPRALAVVLALALALVLALPLAAAHGGGASLPGDSLARARELGAPPARVFEELEAGAPHYYRMHLPEASTLRLVSPWGAKPAGDVLVYVLGPDLPNETRVPEGLERPEGWGALAFLAADDAERVEERWPARVHELLAREISAGERVVIVLSEDAARVALLVESPGVAWEDLALLPSVRGDARAWSGTPTWLAWLVGALGGIVVVAPMLRWRGRPWPLASLLGAFAAATFGASTALLALDALRARHAPWLLLAAGLGLTALAWLASRPRQAPGWRVRVALLACGVVGALTWSGFLWGPVAALAGALIPEPDAGAPADART